VPQWAQMVGLPLGSDQQGSCSPAGPQFPDPDSRQRSPRGPPEQFIEVPRQTAITKDNAPLGVDFLIYWKIVEPLMSQINVLNFAGALQGVAATSLRSVIGDIPLDDVLSEREKINETLRLKLDEVTERWGGKVTTVEIREILPPPAVQEAMNRQLSRSEPAAPSSPNPKARGKATIKRGRRRQAVGDPSRRRRSPGRDPSRSGLQRGPEHDLRSRQEHRSEDDDTAVPRGPQSLGSGPATKFIIRSSSPRSLVRSGRRCSLEFRSDRPALRTRASPKRGS